MTRVDFTEALQQDSTTKDNKSLDNSRRIELNRSVWQKLFYFREKNQLDEKIRNEVIGFFQERYHFDDQTDFQRIWNKIGAKVWSEKNTLTARTLRNIDAAFTRDLAYHGEGIHQPKPPLPVDTTVQKVVQALLHGNNFSLLSVEKRTAKAIFISHDKALMREFQIELQAEMDNLAGHPPENAQGELVWRAFLGNVIALLPFSYPESGMTFTIPVLEENVCRKVEYRTEVIPLSYSKRSSPMPCLGLTAVDDPSAPPILSFIGTTFPAGNGFTATLLADFTPGHSVGELVYKRNKQKISEWLKNKKNVYATGMSLGGAMTFHALRHHPEIARADVYNPPGLYQDNWKKKLPESCQVNIYCQPGDIVSKLGAWPTGDNISLYTVYSHQKGISEDPISAHARAFTGCDKVSIVKEDPQEENRSFTRHLVTGLHKWFGPLAVYLPVNLALLLYRIADSVSSASRYCFQKIGETFRKK